MRIISLGVPSRPGHVAAPEDAAHTRHTQAPHTNSTHTALLFELALAAPDRAYSRAPSLLHVALVLNCEPCPDQR